MIRIVRLGSPRSPDEGLRIGTVRRPPRGVLKSHYASLNWYDVWYPELAPSAALVKQAHQASDEASWTAFSRAYRREMAAPSAAHTLDLLAALSVHADFSIGCYCEAESRCHRGILRSLFEARGASVDPQPS